MYVNGFVDFGRDDTVVTLRIKHAGDTPAEVVAIVAGVLEVLPGNVSIVTDGTAMDSGHAVHLDRVTERRVHIKMAGR